MIEEHCQFCSESYLRYQVFGKELNKMENRPIQLAASIPSLHALVPRLFDNESFYKLVSFVFYVFAIKRPLIETYSFNNSKCHMTFKASKMHPFVRIYGIIRKEAYFLGEN